MTVPRRTVLYVTDLFYQAKGRVYRDEDLFLVERLQQWFDVALCHPRQAVALLHGFDVVVVRNSGPVIHYAAEYAEFRRVAAEARTVVYNPLTGRADMVGKQYLVDLTAAGFPVVPTVDRLADVDQLPDVAMYVVKPKLGSDSIGMQIVDRAGIAGVHEGDALIQPRLDLVHEVSFYVVDDEIQYALYTPDPARRWELAPYEMSDADRAFAARFIEWNEITHGIQRVDGCRTVAGDLLLMELEDLNPYLSLDVLPLDDRERFVAAMAGSINALIEARSA